MNRRLIVNDVKNNRLASFSICVFMAASAMFTGLTILLFGSLSGSVESLMEKARTPDFLQMHTGEIDERELAGFAAGRSDVEAMQICGFLNLENSRLELGGSSLINNTQDNGLSCQSPSFDFLIDPENRVIRPDPGEVYVPVCYRAEYGLEAGDEMRIGPEKLTVAGFLRDSQMNSMMASSKRFLVNEADYERLRSLGSEEYLIEFLLKEGGDVNAFASAYEDAGLPKNGPTITYALIRMMNAISDGMMIFVILLVSVVVLFISMLCIRYMVLTQLEKDKREIGLLKAVGISQKGIRDLYLSKYLLLSAAGGAVGAAGAAAAAGPLGAKMRELYGDAGNTGLIYGLMILGVLAVEGIILASVSRTLGKMEKMSAVDALYGQGHFGKKKNLYLPAAVISAAAVFMILVPLNMASTISAPEFASYMGIGESRIRIDIRQTGDMDTAIRTVMDEIAEDGRVTDFALMRTGSYKAVMPDGNTYNLMIENGDHGRFPVRYVEGRYPEKEGEIALSVLNAKEMEVRPGDTIRVFTDGVEDRKQAADCTVCGIYSDVTNGGKTAKACFGKEADNMPAMWSVVYLSLADESLAHEWVSEYQEKTAGPESGIKVTEIADYLQGTYGQTIRNIRNAAVVSGTLACLILFVVILLFVRLVIWKERRDSSLKKALGFVSADIRKEYLKKVFLYVLPGLAAGVFAGIVPGQSLAGLLMGFMGAYGFRFMISPALDFAAVPAAAAAVSFAAAWISLREVNRIRAYECFGSADGK